MKQLTPMKAPSGNGASSPDRAPKSSVPKWVYWAAGAVLAALVIGAVVHARLAPKIGYLTAPVVRKDLVATVTASGTVNPQDTILVGTQVSGTISELDADFNSVVKTGQVLAQIDPTSLRAQLDAAQASEMESQSAAAAGAASAASAEQNVTVALKNAAAAREALASARSQVGKAKAALDLANLTLRRDQQLLAQGFVPQAQADTDASNAAAAQAAFEAATIAIDQARAQLQAQIAAARASRSQARSASASATANRDSSRSATARSSRTRRSRPTPERRQSEPAHLASDRLAGAGAQSRTLVADHARRHHRRRGRRDYYFDRRRCAPLGLRADRRSRQQSSDRDPGQRQPQWCPHRDGGCLDARTRGRPCSRAASPRRGRFSGGRHTDADPRRKQQLVHPGQRHCADVHLHPAVASGIGLLFHRCRRRLVGEGLCPRPDGRREPLSKPRIPARKDRADP